MNTKCICPLFAAPHYHVSDDPHSVGSKWQCPIHGKQEKTWILHKEKREYCKPCNEKNIAATQQGDESSKVFTYAGSAFEAPEKTRVCLRDKGVGDITRAVMVDREAPIDEGWSKNKQNLLELVEKNPNLLMDALDAAYLAGLDTLQKEREKIIEECSKLAVQQEQRYYEAGKSEAFSLVKEIVKKMTHEEKGYWGTERLKIFGWNGALTEFITRLSTLEGK